MILIHDDVNDSSDPINVKVNIKVDGQDVNSGAKAAERAAELKKREEEAFK